MTQIWRIYNGYIPFALMGLALAVCAAIAVYRWRARSEDRPSARRRTIADFFLLAYVLGLLAATMGPSSGTARTVELVPGHTFMQYLDHPDITAPLAEIVLNVAMWAPFPLIVGFRFMASGRRLIVGSVLAAFSIETLQWVLDIGRASSIDDVLAAAIGAGIGVVLRKVLRNGERHRRHDTRTDAMSHA